MVAADENTPPKNRLFLSLKKNDHFGPWVIEEQQAITAKGFVPKFANNWVMRNLWQQMDHHRRRANTGQSVMLHLHE